MALVTGLLDTDIARIRTSIGTYSQERFNTELAQMDTLRAAHDNATTLLGPDGGPPGAARDTLTQLTASVSSLNGTAAAAETAFNDADRERQTAEAALTTARDDVVDFNTIEAPRREAAATAATAAAAPARAAVATAEAAFTPVEGANNNIVASLSTARGHAPAVPADADIQAMITNAVAAAATTPDVQNALDAFATRAAGRGASAAAIAAFAANFTAIADPATAPADRATAIAAVGAASNAATQNRTAFRTIGRTTTNHFRDAHDTAVNNLTPLETTERAAIAARDAAPTELAALESLRDGAQTEFDTRRDAAEALRQPAIDARTRANDEETLRFNAEGQIITLESQIITDPETLERYRQLAESRESQAARFTGVDAASRPIEINARNNPPNAQPLQGAELQAATDALTDVIGHTDFIANIRPNVTRKQMDEEAAALRNNPDFGNDIQVHEIKVNNKTYFGLTGVGDARQASQFITSRTGQEAIQAQVQSSTLVEDAQKLAIERYKQRALPAATHLNAINGQRDSTIRNIGEAQKLTNANNQYAAAQKTAVDTYIQRSSQSWIHPSKWTSRIARNWALHKADKQQDRAVGASERAAAALNKRLGRIETKANTLAQDRQTNFETYQGAAERSGLRLREIDLDQAQSTSIREAMNALQAIPGITYSDVQGIIDKAAPTARGAGAGKDTGGRGPRG